MLRNNLVSLKCNNILWQSILNASLGTWQSYSRNCLGNKNTKQNKYDKQVNNIKTETMLFLFFVAFFSCNVLLIIKLLR